MKKTCRVAPLAGSVDRNRLCSLPPARSHVAPLAGSVDRNNFMAKQRSEEEVAPLAGSVDRNHEAYNIMQSQRESLPSRGAWIEITQRTAKNRLPYRRSPRGERG